MERVKKTSKPATSASSSSSGTALTSSDPDKSASSGDAVAASNKSDAEKASKVEAVSAETSKVGEEVSAARADVPDRPQPEPAKGPKVSHDWYQTETSVVVEVRVKGIKHDDVSADISATGLNLGIKLDSNREYLLDLHLAHPVVPEKVSRFFYLSGVAGFL